MRTTCQGVFNLGGTNKNYMYMPRGSSFQGDHIPGGREILVVSPSSLVTLGGGPEVTP